MNLVERRLHEHFASLDESNDAAATAEVVDIPQDSRAPVLLQPFAKVNSVAVGSPASEAGLRAGDEIRSFGYVNIENHDGLRRVGECVQGNEGVSQGLC